MSDKQIKGILGTKLGMTQVFDDKNRVVPVTVVKAGPNVVTQIRTDEKDGYTAVQLAFGAIDPRKVNKPRAGHFAKAGVTPRRHIAELRTTEAGHFSYRNVAYGMYEEVKRKHPSLAKYIRVTNVHEPIDLLKR